MIARALPADRAFESPLGRANPLLKLAVALAWFVALFLTTEIVPPLVLVAIVLAAALVVGRVPPAALARGLAPLWTAALVVGLFNTVFATANADPAAAEVARIGPLRLSVEGVAAGVAIAARVLAIAAVGITFAQTTDPTRFVDALVQQARVPARFAYGALAAYQAVPRFAEDLATLRQARRIRGLRAGWHPGLLVGLLVLAIRHGDRMALAMDARAFGTGPRSRYRIVDWTVLDAVVAGSAIVVLVVLLLIG